MKRVRSPETQSHLGDPLKRRRPSVKERVERKKSVEDLELAGRLKGVEHSGERRDLLGRVVADEEEALLEERSVADRELGLDPERRLKALLLEGRERDEVG